MANKLTPIFIIVIGLVIGAAASAMLSQGYMGKTGILQTPNVNSPTTEQAEPTQVVSDNEKRGISVFLINASNDDNIEDELEIDLTDGGFDVVEQIQEKPVQQTTLHHKNSTHQKAEELIEWFDGDYEPVLVADLDESETYDLKLVIGSPLPRE